LEYTNKKIDQIEIIISIKKNKNYKLDFKDKIERHKILNKREKKKIRN
jgi:hypothetical protein